MTLFPGNYETPRNKPFVNCCSKSYVSSLKISLENSIDFYNFTNRSNHFRTSLYCLVSVSGVTIRARSNEDET